MEKQFIKLAIEYWQLAQLAESMLHEIPRETARAKAARTQFLLRQYQRLLQEQELKLVDYTHQRYEANLPVTVMNKEDVDMSDTLVINRTHEPTVIKAGQVIEMGKVFVEPASK